MIALIFAAAEPITLLVAATIIVGLRARLSALEHVRAWELGE